MGSVCVSSLRRTNSFASTTCSSESSESTVSAVATPQKPTQLDRFLETNQRASVAPTTVIIRNIPCRYEQSELLKEVLAKGPECNFFYLPLAKKGKGNRSFGFANFATPEAAQEFLQTFQKYLFTVQGG